MARCQSDFSMSPISMSLRYLRVADVQMVLMTSSKPPGPRHRKLHGFHHQKQENPFRSTSRRSTENVVGFFLSAMGRDGVFPCLSLRSGPGPLAHCRLEVKGLSKSGTGRSGGFLGDPLGALQNLAGLDFHNPVIPYLALESKQRKNREWEFKEWFNIHACEVSYHLE